jgi:hypothetical protein
MEYTPVFCGTNLLSLDELQVNGEGDGNTEMLGLSVIFAVTMMTVKLLGRLTVIIHLGNIQQCTQKVGKATVFFRFPSKAK